MVGLAWIAIFICLTEGGELGKDVLTLEMKETQMNWRERISVDPQVLVGKPVVRGTRLAVEFIVDLLAQGWSEQQILDRKSVV